MTWVDSIIYFFLFFVAPMSLYLKKTGKTFKEVVEEFIDFFKGLGGD